jgi:hypothetical protein
MSEVVGMLGTEWGELVGDGWRAFLRAAPVEVAASGALSGVAGWAGVYGEIGQQSSETVVAGWGASVLSYVATGTQSGAEREVGVRTSVQDAEEIVPDS